MRLRIPATCMVCALGTSTAASAAAQDGAVSGVVLAAAFLRPLEGTEVLVAGTPLRTRTDAAGRFAISGLAARSVTLEVRHLGYRPLSRLVAVGERSLRLVLVELAIKLDALVVTGTAGATEARAVGNAVGIISAQEVLDRAPVADVQQLFNARVPSLVIMPIQGNVGTGSVTRVRGVASLFLPNEPLLYVDGIRVDNNTRAGPDIRNGRQMSRANDLNPEDIETAEVIKGPAAATLYGTEASRGVIQILTRKGREGPPQWRAVIKHGANWFMNPGERLPTVYGRDSSTGQLRSLNLYRQERAAGRPLFQTGRPQGYHLSLSGGAQGVRYYLSGAYDRDEGVLWYNWRRRIATRANVSLFPSERAEVRASFGVVQNDVRLGQAATLWDLMTQLVWGTPLTDTTRLRGFFRATPEDVATIQSTSEIDRVIASVQLHHRPRDWLVQQLTVGADVGNETSARLFPRHPLGGDGPFEGRSLGEKTLDRQRVRYTTVDYRVSAAFDASAALRSVSTLGAQYYANRVVAAQLVGRGFPYPGVTEIGGAAQTQASEQSVENKTVGGFAEHRFEWKNRLYLTAALRADDNSAFGPTFDPITYPKLHASWVVSEEPFWRGTPWISMLRLRAAWGRAGQQPDAFAIVRSYQPTTGPDDQGTLTPWNVGNPHLRPERGEEVELGLDAGLFDERLGLEATYYDQRIKDAIAPSVLAPSGGFPGVKLENIGEVMNRGFELAVRARPIRSRSVSWELNFTWSANENRIVSLGNTVQLASVFGGTAYAPTQFHQQGFPIGAVFLPRIVSASLDASGNLATAMCAGGPDLGSEDGTLVPCDNATPRVYAGRPTPSWEGSVSTALTFFGNLRIHALVDFRGGHVLQSVDFGFAHNTVQNTRQLLERTNPLLVAYTTLQTNVPGPNWGGRTATVRGGFAKLRELSAAYILPDAWARRLRASRATVTVAGRNLAILWQEQRELFGLEVIDPESRYPDDLSGRVQNVLPQFAQFVAAVRLTF